MAAQGPDRSGRLHPERANPAIRVLGRGRRRRIRYLAGLLGRLKAGERITLREATRFLERVLHESR